jgi:hypothetical protein
VLGIYHASELPTSSSSLSPTISSTSAWNRKVTGLLNLRRARALDVEVRLSKNGTVPVGSNYAETSTAWSHLDQITSYGGAADTWGTTWNFDEINANTFSSLNSFIMPVETGFVDFHRITLFYYSVLPVTFLSFDATKSDDDDADLLWNVESESNISNYVIERSYDGMNYESIGSIDVQHTSDTVKTYKYLDRGGLKKATYYRISSIDFDGNASCSEVRYLESNFSETSLFPNPSADFLEVSSVIELYESIITDLNGKIIDRHYLESGSKSDHYSIEQFPDGKYFLWINTSKGTEVHSFTKVTK